MRRFLSAIAVAAVLLTAPARAAVPDPVDFLFRLGMIEGHLMIGRELIEAGQTKLALPHFGHPVQELYDDIEPWLSANHVAPFNAQLAHLEAAAASAPTAAATRKLYDEVIATLHAARLTTPAALRESIPEMIRICSDTVDAAAGEYGEAVDQGRVENLVEYHDSRGYLAFVAQELDRLAAAAPSQAAVVAAFRAVLEKAQWIVAPLMPPTEPRATVGAYRAIAAEAAKLANP